MNDRLRLPTVADYEKLPKTRTSSVACLRKAITTVDQLIETAKTANEASRIANPVAEPAVTAEVLENLELWSRFAKQELAYRARGTVSARNTGGFLQKWWLLRGI